MPPSYAAHLAEHVTALGALTFTQWFAGRTEFNRDHRPASRDLGEQAMRADYIADKAWWYLTYEPEAYPTLAEATAAARAELPEPASSPRVPVPAWVDRLDHEVSVAAVSVPARQWSTTLVPIRPSPARARDRHGTGEG